VPAAFIIDHGAEGEVDPWLVSAFGEPTPEALGDSVIGAPVKDNPRYYGWCNYDHILIAHKPTNQTLNVMIEPRGKGSLNMREVCQTTWHALLESCDGMTPALRALSLYDGVDGPEVVSASTARAAHLRSSEIVPAVTIATVTTVVVVGAVLAGAPRQLLLGMIAPVVGALVLVCLALVRSRRKKLVWK
jgi:hypothetical protein